MLLCVSIMFIFLLTSLIVYNTYLLRKRLSPMAAMVISMTSSMLTSVALGTFLGIYILEKDLTLPTIIAVSIGMFIGYITGRPISLIVSLEGMTAGVMGGMMGAMLGVMVPPNNTEVIVCFIDVVYLLVYIVLFRVIAEETNSSKTISKLLPFIFVLVLIGLLVWLNFLFLFN
ncbi:hypothetical protein ABES03_00020 [Neobacillus rhizosphaerae]|uniref:hypothetical protein n=1 Tax=Neobacillus rhizosphaerae TaxID=2880965 RepID=UPI003D2B6CF3